MGFKELYLSAKTLEEKDNLIFEYSKNQSRPKMIPMIINFKGIKIALNVMKDFFNIDGMIIPILPKTAEKIADYFEMNLPTTKIANLIIKNSYNIITQPTFEKEYKEAYFKGIDNKVKIIINDKIINTTLDKILSTKNISNALSYTPGIGIIKYGSSFIAGPPAGYRSAKIDSAYKNEAGIIAKNLLRSPMWTMKEIELSNGKKYLAKVEPHSNAAKGVSLYEKISTPIKYTKKKKENIINRILKFIDEFNFNV